MVTPIFQIPRRRICRWWLSLAGRMSVNQPCLTDWPGGASPSSTIPAGLRDRLALPVRQAGRDFMLVDTGGLEPFKMSGEDNARSQQRVIAAAIRRQTEAALQTADMAIMVVDLQAGIVPLDEEAAAVLRRIGLPVLLAANKADSPAHDHEAGEFHRLGFPVLPDFGAAQSWHCRVDAGNCRVAAAGVQSVAIGRALENHHRWQTQRRQIFFHKCAFTR